VNVCTNIGSVHIHAWIDRGSSRRTTCNRESATGCAVFIASLDTVLVVTCWLDQKPVRV